MKKLLLSLAIFAGISSVNAQTPVGTVVGNFTLTDINGNTHTLFDYLDAGKMVVIDVSATWCGPCWSYHNTGALNDFYNAKGPNGTNEAMVFFIEGDTQTSVECLSGDAGCIDPNNGNNSQGDWVTGEDMPIINLTTQASFENTGLDIAYFPVMYVICPNRTVYKSGVAGGIGTLALLNSYVGGCPAPASQPADVAVLANKGETAHCEGIYTPKVQIQNNGTDALTSATISITQGGNVVSTGTYTGNLATYGVATVTCSDIPNFTGGTLNVTVSTTGDAAASNNTLNIAVAGAQAAASQFVSIHITTDRYGSETTWRLKNAAGQTVQSGGPYTNLSSNTTAVQPVVYAELNPSECYKFEVLDSYDDGMCCNYGNGGYEIKDATGAVIVSGGEFTSSDVKLFKTGVLGINELAQVAMNVYPNPASTEVNVSFEASNADYTVKLVDLQGRVIAIQNLSNLNGTQVISIPTSNVAKGSYVVSITSNGMTSTKSVVIK
ncbi:MAG: T9SS type A sorting domain-containing protein [Flavobacteriales bacterium]|nr:T9SS type A sorting domain-containing protein [Flavobacteriales bacterium]